MVHDQADLPVGEDLVDEISDQKRSVDSGAQIRDFHHAAAEQWSEHHEEPGDAAAFILEVLAGRLPCLSGTRRRVSVVCCFEVSSRQTTPSSSNSR